MIFLEEPFDVEEQYSSAATSRSVESDDTWVRRDEISVKSRKRANTTGGTSSRRSRRSRRGSKSLRHVLSDNEDHPPYVNPDDDLDEHDDDVEGSSDSSPRRSGSSSRSRERRKIEGETLGSTTKFAGLRDVDDLQSRRQAVESVDFDTATDTSSRKISFSQSRSRSTGTFRTEVLASSTGLEKGPSTSSSIPTSSSSDSKRPSRWSGWMSGPLKRSHKHTVEDVSISTSPPRREPSESEGNRLRRAKVRRSSSSSSLDSQTISTRRLQTPTSPISSPPVSPTNPPKNSKTGFAKNFVESSGYSSRDEPSAVPSHVKKPHKPRSPPPSGRRPKSGSISTADRDHSLNTVSPRPSFLATFFPIPILLKS